MSGGSLPCGCDLDLQTWWRLNTSAAITAGLKAEHTEWFVHPNTYL